MKQFLKKRRRKDVTGKAKAHVRKRLALTGLFLAFLLSVQLIPVPAACRPLPMSFKSKPESEVFCPGSATGKRVVRRISSSEVKLSKTSYKYDGKAKKPSVTVRYCGKKLKKNRDYTVSYANNRKRGTAKVIVRGKGDYSGTITKTFRIR